LWHRPVKPVRHGITGDSDRVSHAAKHIGQSPDLDLGPTDTVGCCIAQDEDSQPGFGWSGGCHSIIKVILYIYNVTILIFILFYMNILKS
jgi:hypothetical protein